MIIISGIIIIILCIALEGFFAGSEIGFISCNRMRMSSLSNKKDKRAGIVLSFLEKPEKFLSTTLVGVNLSVIIATSVTTAIVSKYITIPGRDALIATLIILPLILIFGEMIPKIIYQQHPDRFSLISAYPLKVASILLFPFVFLATGISNLVSGAFMKKHVRKNPYVSREEIRLLMLEGAKQGILDKSEIAMTGEIFDFGRTSVQSVMVPIKNVISLSDHSNVSDIIGLMEQSGYSRIPIYHEKEDNIIGIIEMSSLAGEDIENKSLKGLMLTPYKVEWNKPLEDILKDFQSNQENVAVVVNKDGRSIGIATIEDIVEEIVGEIEDEYDVAS